MFGRECSLCGGKLRGNVCTECGLDNSKNDSMYKGMANRSSCDGQPLTHVHEEPVQRPEKSAPRKAAAVKPAKTTKKNTYTSTYSQEPKKKKGRKVAVILAIIACISTLADACVAILEDTSLSLPDFGTGVEEVEVPPAAWDVEDEGMYADVAYELEETGVYWASELTGGEYVVGVHIPEGNYRVVAEKGDCYFSVEDWDNGIYFWGQMAPEWMEYNDTYYEVSNLRLYNGAKVLVDGYYALWLETENANQQENVVQNPLTEEVIVTNGQRLIAGTDFPAGTYDVYALPGGGYLEFEAPIPEGEEFAEYYMNTVWLYDENEGDIRYRNLVIPEGVEMHLDGYDENEFVILKPSAVIATEDYKGYQMGEY